MTLLETLADPSKNLRRSCYTADWLASLDTETRAGVLAALANPSWKSTDLHILVQDTLGYNRQYTSFRLHRTAHCSCPRVAL